MDRKLTLLVCNFIAPEIAEVLKNGNYPDVELVRYPASCNAPVNTQQSIKRIVSGIDEKSNDIVILSSNCLPDSFPELKASHIKLIALKQCFEPFLNSELVFHFIRKGYYLATNGWLKSYKQHIKNWGFCKNTAPGFFKESMEKLVLLDTQIPGDYSTELDAILEYMQLPNEIIPIGLDHCKNYIDSIVSNWRYDIEQAYLKRRLAAASKQSADYLVVLSQLSKLVNLRDENEVVGVGFDIIKILFAPQACKFFMYKNGNKVTFYDTTLKDDLIFENVNSFKIDLFEIEEHIGTFEVIEVGFPHYIKQYEVMGKTIGQLFSIALANAQKFQTIVAQKAEIAKYAEQLKDSNKTKDRFFSIVAHDLKGPIGSAHALSGYLLSEAKMNALPDVERYASLVNSSLDETYNLLVNLLDWARSQLQRMEFKPANLHFLEIVQNVKSIYLSQLEKKGLHVSLDFEKELTVFADKQMITTIIRNLISNAIKFSLQGGEIVLSAHEKENYVEISVKDSGVGMKEELTNNLFALDVNKSETGTSGETGTGLGLILCKEFIEKHGGEIEVESVLNRGTTIRFLLPKIEPDF